MAGTDRRGGSTSALVTESWERSRRLGVDPDSSVPVVDIEGSRLSAHAAAHPMSAVLPVIDSVLVDGVVSSGHLVAVADESGRLLRVVGERGTRARAESMTFVPGAVWSDDCVGANAPGLALRHDRALRVRGAEHFLSNVHAWSCSAAPVHHPVTGAVIGLIDVTGPASAGSDEMLALVRATAMLAETELRSSAPGPLTGAGAPERARRLRVLGSSSPRLGTDRAVSRRHAEILVLLGAHPGGLTGGALAEELADDRLDDVSVRAEVSRLRRVLGAGVLESRPYRLRAGAVRSDLDDVTEALDRGDIEMAVAEYPGPLLPASDAPGVVELRDELHERLRAGVLASGSAPALRAWVTGAGADDMRAWQALTRESSGRPVARAEAETMSRVLDRRLG